MHTCAALSPPLIPYNTAPRHASPPSGADQAPSALREAGREYSRLQPLAAAYDRLTAVRKEVGGGDVV